MLCWMIRGYPSFVACASQQKQVEWRIDNPGATKEEAEEHLKAFFEDFC